MPLPFTPMMKHPLSRWVMPLLLLAASTQAQAEFILFPSLTATDNRGLNPHPQVQHPAHVPRQSDLQPELDLFYSADKNRFRILAEVLSKPGSTSLERIQLGWLLAPQTTLWLGRHHSPLGYWNTQFHHGMYLQTSIKRPAISGFDDHGGVLPNHLTGLFIESEQPLENDATLIYALSAGATTRLKSSGKLAAFDVLHPNEGTHKLGVVARLGYRPSSTEDDIIGVFAAHSIMPSAVSDIQEIRQAVVGSFFNHEQGRWRWIGELYGVRNDLDRPQGKARSTFGNLNLQGEYSLQPDWRLYGRVEDTFGDDSGAYLMHFSGFVKKRYMIGMRYELGPQQALKLEFSDVHVAGDSYEQLALQWSAAFP